MLPISFQNIAFTLALPNHVVQLRLGYMKVEKSPPFTECRTVTQVRLYGGREKAAKTLIGG